jgi:type III pantothenate kinase
VWDIATRLILSTVVPPLEATITQACDAGPIIVPVLSIDHRSRREFELDLPHPEQLGADRLANVAGAMTLADPPFLIVDAGTATTFCVVDHRRAYVGGAISPGLEISWRALQQRAAKLFSVQLNRPASALGNTTETQLQSGVLHGCEVFIDAMADRLLAAAGLHAAARFATGGCMNLIAAGPRFRVEPDLTLLGLFRYGQLNA